MLVQVNAPGRYPPLDILTFLQHVPERFAPWLRDARGVNKLRRELFFDRLLKETEANLRAGKAKGCYIEDLLNNQASLGITREQIGYVLTLCAEIVTHISPNAGISAQSLLTEVQHRNHCLLDGYSCAITGAATSSAMLKVRNPVPTDELV